MSVTAGGQPAPSARARSDTAVLFGGKLLSNAGQVGLAIVTARDLGPSGRGTVVLLMTVVIVTTLVSSFGTSVVMRTRLAAGGEAQLPLFLGLSGALALVQVALTAVTVLLMSWAVDLALEPTKVALASLLGGVSLIVWLLIDITFGVGRPRAVAVADVVGSMSQLALYLGAVLAFDASVDVVLGAVLAGYALEAALLARVLPTRSVSHDAGEWRSLLRAGLPSMRQAVAEFTAYRMNRIVIGVAGNAAEVGVYSVAATGAELLRLLPLAVGQVVSPRVAGGHIEIVHLRSVRLLVLLVMAGAGVAMATVGGALVVPILGEEFRQAREYLAVLAAAEVALAMYQIDVHTLQGLGRYAQASHASVLCGPAILLLNIALVSPMGPTGAALASLIGFSAMAIVSRRELSRSIAS